MRVLGNNFNITVALLEHLDNIYLDRLPLEQITPEELAFLRGQQSVLQKLREMQNTDLEED